MIRIGCCGFCKAQERYFTSFNCIEVQKTFYDPPELETLRKWRQKAPEGFAFTVKAWQLITHVPESPTYRKLKVPIQYKKKNCYGSFKPTEEVFEAWEKTLQCARTLDAEVIIFQTPASFKPVEENMDNMRLFFNGIDRFDFIIGFESRGHSWTNEKIKEICSELELIDVVDPFVRMPTHGEIFYFRLHGKGGYRYRYTDEDLVWLKKVAEKYEDGFVMFNNVYMSEDAERFKRLFE